jgi:hypothetical protein
MNLTQQFPELTELDGLYNLTQESIKTDVAKVKTPFAFATAPFREGADHYGYDKAAKQLAKAGWECLGNRYNALHGPNYISLWWLKLNHKPQDMAAIGPYAGCYYQDGPKKNFPKGYRYAQACCGLHLGSPTAKELPAWKASQFLQLIRMEGGSVAGYTCVAAIGKVSYWTNSNQGNFSKRCICQ